MKKKSDNKKSVDDPPHEVTAEFDTRLDRYMKDYEVALRKAFDLPKVKTPSTKKNGQKKSLKKRAT